MNTAPRRDPFGIILATIMLMAAGGLTLLAVTATSWAMLLLLLPAAILLTLGATGAAMSLPSIPRDEKGNPRQ